MPGPWIVPPSVTNTILLALNLATLSSVLLNLLHKRRMRGSLVEAAGDKPSGRSSSCSKWTTPSLAGGKKRGAPAAIDLLSGKKDRKESGAHWYTETLPVVSVDLVKSFRQGGVDDQLVTCPALRRRLSLSSLFFAFHHISQHLGTQRHGTTPSFPSRHRHSSSAGVLTRPDR